MLILSKLPEKNHDFDYLLIINIQFNVNFYFVLNFNSLHCLRFIDAPSANQHGDNIQVLGPKSGLLIASQIHSFGIKMPVSLTDRTY